MAQFRPRSVVVTRLKNDLVGIGVYRVVHYNILPKVEWIIHKRSSFFNKMGRSLKLLGSLTKGRGLFPKGGLKLSANQVNNYLQQIWQMIDRLDTISRYFVIFSFSINSLLL